LRGNVSSACGAKLRAPRRLSAISYWASVEFGFEVGAQRIV
jgi:hypothetical protein